MKSLDYLQRGNCTSCTIDSDGVLKHCDNHQALYDLALIELLDLAKKPNYQQKKKIEAQRVLDEYNMKMSHSWASAQTFTDATRTRMAPYPSHCKKCGVDFMNFKLRPFACPKGV